jgi:hypothetical protein
MQNELVWHGVDVSKVPQQIRWFGLMGLVTSISLVAFRADTLPLENALLAVAIIWVGIIPSVAYLNQLKTDRAPFPLAPLVGIFYLVFFGLPAFIAYYLIRPPAAQSYLNDSRIAFYGAKYIDTISLEAQTLVLFGVALMFLTWGMGKRYLFRSIPVMTLHEPRDGRAPLFIAWALALVSLAYWTIPEIRTLPSIGQFLQPAGFLAFAIFYLCSAQGKLNRVNKVVYFFIVLPAWLGNLIAIGSLTPVLLFFTLWPALRFSIKISIPKIVLVAPLVLFLVYPYVHEFRAKYWNAVDQSSVLSKVLGFGSIVASGLVSGKFGSKSTPDLRCAWAINSDDTNSITFNTCRIREQAADNTRSEMELGPLLGLVRRVSLILPLSHVVEATPNPISYWGGETYQTLFTGWIPRVIWPDKPKESWGNVFGHRYGIIFNHDTFSINIPWITEMYANFGRTGILLGMVFVGLFLGFLDTFLNSPNRNTWEQAVGATVLLPLFFQESNFTLMTGSLPLLILSFWLIFSVGFRIKFPWASSSNI